MTATLPRAASGARSWPSVTRRSQPSLAGIPSRLLVTVFLFSGAVAGIAGGLFASLQSYITPDAFTFDLSVLFFTPS